MGRSVSYPSGATVAFQETPEDVQSDDGWLFWQDFVDDICESAKSTFPSLWEDEIWLGREDRGLLANNLARIGVSEYCGLVAVWLVPRDDLEPRAEALAETWVRRVAPRFVRTFGTLRKLGTFSNGEAVFQRTEVGHG